MKELEVSKQLPVIKTNFEDVKASLQESIKKYEGIIVTEESLKDCKATQKDLSKVRRTIDDYRKTVKKEVLAPVTEFENQCKELEKLIADVEKPIKEGINVFDNKVREEKKAKAAEIIQDVITRFELKEKYSSQLTILDKYFNLTGSIKAIKEDVEVRTTELKSLQDAEEREKEQLKNSINVYVEQLNEDIKRKLVTEDFYRYILEGRNIQQISNIIKMQHDAIKEAENPKPVEPPKEEIKEPVKIPIDIKQPIQEPAVPQEEKLFYYDVKVIANYENMKRLTDLLKSEGFQYEVKDKGIYK
jgi:hypothetical protein